MTTSSEGMLWLTDPLRAFSSVSYENSALPEYGESTGGTCWPPLRDAENLCFSATYEKDQCVRDWTGLQERPRHTTYIYRSFLYLRQQPEVQPVKRSFLWTPSSQYNLKIEVLLQWLLFHRTPLLERTSGKRPSYLPFLSLSLGPISLLMSSPTNCTVFAGNPLFSKKEIMWDQVSITILHWNILRGSLAKLGSPKV